MNKKKPGVCWDMNEEDFLKNANPMKVMILVNQMHRKTMEKLLDGTGLHRAQHRLLMTLADREFNSQAELAKGLEVSTATVAVSLKKLERDGYIQKKAKEEDSRANFVKLTVKGEEVVERSRKIFETVDKQGVKGFSEQDLVVFRKYLKHVYDNLSEIN